METKGRLHIGSPGKYRLNPPCWDRSCNLLACPIFFRQHQPAGDPSPDFLPHTSKNEPLPLHKQASRRQGTVPRSHRAAHIQPHAPLRSRSSCRSQSTTDKSPFAGQGPASLATEPAFQPPLGTDNTLPGYRCQPNRRLTTVCVVSI